jgi:hypothetical protein
MSDPYRLMNEFAKRTFVDGYFSGIDCVAEIVSGPPLRDGGLPGSSPMSGSAIPGTNEYGRIPSRGPRKGWRGATILLGDSCPFNQSLQDLKMETQFTGLPYWEGGISMNKDHSFLAKEMR